MPAKDKNAVSKSESRSINIDGKRKKITIASHVKNHLNKDDIDMDLRIKSAVKSAVSKAKICNKPVARYDVREKKAFLEYPDGVRRYVR